MLLDDLYTELSYGELSNLALANNGNGTIVEENKPQIVNYANEALLRLYTRFTLKESELFLEMVEGVIYYKLEKKYAQSSYVEGEVDYPYIRDNMMLAPFTGDVLKINMVIGSCCNELPLNDTGKCNSVFTPEKDVLQNPNITPGEVLNVIYQAKHNKLVYNSNLSIGKTIIIPDTLLEAFKSYIAYKVFAAIGTQEMLGISQGHLVNYERICNEVLMTDTTNSSFTTTSCKFNNRGWI